MTKLRADPGIKGWGAHAGGTNIRSQAAWQPTARSLRTTARERGLPLLLHCPHEPIGTSRPESTAGGAEIETSLAPRPLSGLAAGVPIQGRAGESLDISHRRSSYGWS